MTVIQLSIFFLLTGLFLYAKKRLIWKKLKKYESDISGSIVVSEKYNGEKVLTTNSFVQGISVDDPSIKKSYWYVIADEILKHCHNKKDARVLFIGLGANTSSLLVHKKNPSIHLVIVEIDPMIVTVNKEFFQLDTMKNAEIITADIYSLLTSKKSSWENIYDTIVIDTFDAKPPYLLKGSHEPEFLNILYTWIKKDGMFLFNAPIKTQGINVNELLKYLKQIFKHANHRIIHDPRGFHNHVIAASVKHKR